DNRFGQSTFQEADLNALAAFAAHTAFAIENARLHRDARRQQQALAEAHGRAEAFAKKLEAELARTGDELGRVQARLSVTQSQLASRSGYGEIKGSSHPMQELYKLLDKVKDSD